MFCKVCMFADKQGNTTLTDFTVESDMMSSTKEKENSMHLPTMLKMYPAEV